MDWGEETTTKKEYLQEFTQDIIRVFPEYSPLIKKWGKLEDDEVVEIVWTHLIQSVTHSSIPLLIILKNEELWKNSEYNTEFLPGIVFRILWQAGISDSTKDKIWKYLQFPILFHSPNPNTEEGEGEEAQEEPSHEKEEGEVPNGFQRFMQPDFFEKLKEKKIGKLVMEMMVDFKDDFEELGVNESDSPEKIIKELFSNPHKLTNTMSKMQEKLEHIKNSGEANEYLGEARELLETMDMKEIQRMIIQMGLGGRKTKVNQSAMQAKMAQQKSQMDIKSRLRAKLAKKQAESKGASSLPIPKISEEEKYLREEEQRKREAEVLALFASTTPNNSQPNPTTKSTNKKNKKKTK